MADIETVWDADVAGPGTFTAWDEDIAGPGTRTQWDLLPAIIGKTVRIIWRSAARRVSWLNARRRVQW